MVSITVSLKGKPTINCDFPAKHPNNVTVREIKAAVQAKFPKVSPDRSDSVTYPDNDRWSLIDKDSPTLSKARQSLSL
jgi:very-long-chain enoyl-CoA reductase